MSQQDLKKVGLRVTLPRLKILQILENSQQRHVSAEDVYRMLLSAGDDVGLATVYRVLTQFEEVGLINRHNFEGDHSVFELNRGEHHDHMVCTCCGVVKEFHDEVIEQKQQEAAEKLGFNMTDHVMIIYGTCQDNKQCKKNQSKKVKL
ncbi:ferric iron uptake transcriptional regulator [Piscirickettsia salmonis]|uniref:ferric iron uptake transcriptional regulator n=1 Tax=Piscirickettsia salmonis TaxID=1238 RepID=UPI003EC15535